MNQQAVAQVQNPFGAQAPAVTESAAAQSDAERAAQEVQAKLVIAKKFPRDPIAAMDRITNACTRPTLAQGALYSYNRGGTEVTGPSIRLAEAMAQSWGNIDFGIRELSSANGMSSVEAFAWDMETNTRQSKVFQVPHVRYTRNSGVKQLVDPRDIYEQVANQGARRLRACILGVIPGDVTEAAVEQCSITQAAHVDTSPEAREKLLTIFQKYGVTKEMIEARIQRRLDSIQPAQMQSLLNIALSIKDGMSKAQDWFDMGVMPDPVAAPTSDLNAALTGEQKPAEETMGDQEANEDEPPPIMDADEFNAVLEEVAAVTTEEGLKEQSEFCSKAAGDGRIDDHQAARLVQAISNRRRELKKSAGDEGEADAEAKDGK